jgi:hypothetical protein
LETHTPTLKTGTLGISDLEKLIDIYEPLVQVRTEAQDVFDESERAVLVMKTLAVKVTAIIEVQPSENESIREHHG